MRIFLISTFILILLNNCSFNKDSKFWTEDSSKKKVTANKLKEIIKKSNDLLSMSFDEYEFYIEDYVKKSKFPNINK